MVASRMPGYAARRKQQKAHIMETNRSQPHVVRQLRSVHLEQPRHALPRQAIASGLALITTKLHPPAEPVGLLAREQLTAQLARAQQRALTLVVAPAGYGKTTLLSSWARRADQLVAWVGLDTEDTAPSRFWAYVLAALDRVVPGVSAAAQQLLAVAPGASEPMLGALINALADAPPVTLVLDDYHAIAAGSRVHQTLEFLLSHLPEPLRVVIASRSQPPLPLAHWRASDTLGELGVRDMRFTPAEAAAFLASGLQLPVPDDLTAALVEITEGWAAGLRFAVRAARASADPLLRLRAFGGAEPELADYLFEEVGAHAPAELAAFVCQTVVLDVVTPASCAAVCDGAPDAGAAELAPGTSDTAAVRQARELLRQVERSGLFLTTLDSARESYRYHPLVAAALERHLERDQPALLATLRQRAAAWQAAQPAEEGQPHAAGRPAAEFSSRELEVLQLLAAGLNNQAIARQLFVSVNTVKMHVQHLYGKLEAHNRVQAIQQAYARGLV